MHYDFIEIGTSDFDTLLEKADPQVTGISVEPIAYYLDRLPNNHIVKANSAISDCDGDLLIYWVRPNLITENGLPDWVRGCNSINEPHPTVVSLLEAKGLPDLMESLTCKVLSWDSFVELYEISSIGHLKIDTEGHDPVILNALLQSKYSIRPVTITFESNELSLQHEPLEILHKLTSLGYEIADTVGANITVKLKQ